MQLGDVINDNFSTAYVFFHSFLVNLSARRHYLSIPLVSTVENQIKLSIALYLKVAYYNTYIPHYYVCFSL